MYIGCWHMRLRCCVSKSIRLLKRKSLKTSTAFLQQYLPVACEFDDLSENNILNQIIKTTAFLLMRDENVKAEYRIALKKEMLFFANVAEINLKSIRWNMIRFQRNNQSYRMLVSICQLVLEGMLMTTDSGKYNGTYCLIYHFLDT